MRGRRMGRKSNLARLCPYYVQLVSVNHVSMMNVSVDTAVTV
jgi:hypothetical protein